ncbi:MAG TPA: phosphoribosyltransferase family protein [Chthoniobacteraceae bacterium]|nr:phosphoribosyltransferase family protein [Chthoniobacteraceae bacterium]
MSFVDRSDAGRKLALALSSYKGEDVVVLALPRGGVQVAAEVAIHLAAPLDLLLVRKIGLPSQPELAMGAVVDGAEPIVVRNDRVIRLARVSAEEFDAACARELAEIDRRRRRYIGSRAPEPVAGRVVIIVDDGIATGATVLAAIRGLRRREPRKIVLAVPVAPPDEVEELRGEVDDLICLQTPERFGAIGYFYDEFRQLSDEDVVQMMDSAREAEDKRKPI